MSTINNQILSMITNILQTERKAYLVEEATEEDIKNIQSSNKNLLVDSFDSKTGSKSIIVRLNQEDPNKDKQKQRESADKSYNGGYYKSASTKYEYLLSTTGYIGPIIYYRLGVSFYQLRDYETSLYYFNIANNLYSIKGYDTKQLKEMMQIVLEEWKNKKQGTIKDFTEPQRPSLVNAVELEKFIIGELRTGVDLATLLTAYGFRREELQMIQLIVAKQAYLQNRKDIGDQLIRQVEQAKDKCIDVIKYMTQLQHNKTLYIAKSKEHVDTSVKVL